MRYAVARYPLHVAGMAALRLLGLSWSEIGGLYGMDKSNARRAVMRLYRG